MRTNDKTSTILTWVAAGMLVLVAVVGVMVVGGMMQELAAAPRMPLYRNEVAEYRLAIDTFKSEMEGVLRMAALIIVSLLASAGMLLAFVRSRVNVA
jgi:hypothetical protein